MTDQRATEDRAADADGLEPRLERWFAGELARAKADVQRGVLVRAQPASVRRGTTGRRTAWAGLLATTSVAVLLVVALVGGFLGAGLTPSPSASGGTPSSATGIVMGPNGTPTSIDGHPVLTVQDGLARAAQSTDATTFLVGGWLSDEHASCPAPTSPSPALLFTGLCGGQPALLGSPPFDAQGQPAVDVNGLFLWPVFLDGSSPPEPRPDRPVGQQEQLNLAVVLRVHTHDASAAACSTEVRNRCDQAVVVDAVLWTSTTTAPVPSPSDGLYADGIPAIWDGQPVLRPTQAASVAQTRTDATTFLIGGWVIDTSASKSCPIAEVPAPEQELLGGSCPIYLAESAGAGGPGPFTLHFQAEMPGLGYAGPVIIRVHTHDPLAASCAPANADACAHAVVVDALLWDGPMFGLDGLPSWVGGRPTVSVPEAIDQLSRSNSSASFLVRGWFGIFPIPCPSVLPTNSPPLSSDLLPIECDPAVLSAVPIPAGQYRARPSDLNLTMRWVLVPTPGEVVLEIHGHDPAAASCAPSIRTACEAAVIVDQVIWSPALGPSPSNGLSAETAYPASIGGEPVLDVLAAAVRATAHASSNSFLVGGWMQADLRLCPLLAPSPHSRLIPECSLYELFETVSPGPQVPFGAGRMIRPVFPTDGLQGPAPSWVVLRVHVDDPEAASCEATIRERCLAAIVVDGIVWPTGTR